MTEQYTFSLDITPGGAPPVVHAVQYDNLARALCITLTDGSGDLSPLTDVTGAYLYGRRPDGSQIALAAEYSDGTVTAALTASFTAQAGAMLCLVCLTGADEAVLGSAPFILEVAENPCDAGSVTASDDFRDAVSGWARDHADELTAMYGEAVSAVTALTAGYQPENMLFRPYVYEEGQERYGITYTVNADGSIHCEGTPTETSSFYLCSGIELPAGTYTLSGGQSGVLNVRADNTVKGKNYICTGKPVTFTAEAGDKWNIRVRIASGTGEVNTEAYPMLALGSAAQAYADPALSRANLLRRIEKLEGNT